MRPVKKIRSIRVTSDLTLRMLNEKIRDGNTLSFLAFHAFMSEDDQDRNAKRIAEGGFLRRATKLISSRRNARSQIVSLYPYPLQILMARAASSVPKLRYPNREIGRRVVTASNGFTRIRNIPRITKCERSSALAGHPRRCTTILFRSDTFRPERKIHPGTFRLLVSRYSSLITLPTEIQPAPLYFRA